MGENNARWHFFVSRGFAARACVCPSAITNGVRMRTRESLKRFALLKL